MTDAEMIDRIAEQWIAYGGDAEGLSYCWARIKQAIERKLEERNDESIKEQT